MTAPVIVTGRILQPAGIEAILSSGAADGVGLVRALISDPDFVRKMRDDQASDIRQCIGCNQSCIGHRNVGAPVSCIQNPSTGRETWVARHPAAERIEDVLVVGGGPAGMKAAVIAASRGHRVTLHERSRDLGGQVRLAQLLPGRAEFGGLSENLKRELDRLKVDICLGSDISAEDVRRGGPDRVIIATGARAGTVDILGREDGHVLDASDVLMGAKAGSRVLVADLRGDWIAPGIAQQLAAAGSRVTISTSGHGAGEALQVYVRNDWMGRLRAAQVAVQPLTRLVGVDADTAYLECTVSGETVIVEGIDTVVTCSGYVPVDDLEQALGDWGGAVEVIGDAASPRTAEEAVFDGFIAGMRAGTAPSPQGLGWLR